jgi:hypothetical protein
MRPQGGPAPGGERGHVKPEKKTKPAGREENPNQETRGNPPGGRH